VLSFSQGDRGDQGGGSLVHREIGEIREAVLPFHREIGEVRETVLL